VKGVNFVDLTDAGDPVELAARYDAEGADEIVFLDITASSDKRETIVDLARRTAEEVFIPFTIGGGVREVDDARRLLRAGADKVSVMHQYSWRERLQNQVRPVSMVLARDSSFIQAIISTWPVPSSWTMAGTRPSAL